MVSTRMNISRATRVFTVGLVGLVVLTMTANSVVGDDGHPIAIRNWEQGVTIETMWGFQIGLGVTDATLGKLPRKPDLVLADVSVGESVTLQRLPNQAKPSMSKEPGDSVSEDRNAVVVERGKEGAPAMVTVDGLTVVYLDAVADAEFAKQLEGKQVVVVATGDGLKPEMYATIVDALKPKLMVVKAGVEKVGEQTVESVSHNTVAVSSGKQTKAKTRIVSLSTEGYKMSKQLTTLFEKKEAACKKSREVFAKLSVAQMNFKPAKKCPS